MTLPWYRQVNRDQWQAFLAAFLGWVLDGFDFMILTFVIIDIQHSFTVDAALAGALGTVTMLTRLIGGIGAGTAADKWGRKGPLILSILWFTIFAFLSGFSKSYAMLFGLRALFGIGMGGEWAAGMPLAIEHWPAHLRGMVSGLLQGGFSWGVILASLVFQYVYPIFNGRPDLGWRVMFWSGVIPGLLGPVDRERRQRKPGLAGSAKAPEGSAADGAGFICASFSARSHRRYPPDFHPHGGFHLFVSLHILLVCHISAGEWIQAVLVHDCLECRRHHRRDRLGPCVAENAWVAAVR